MIFDWPANLIPTDITINPPRETAGDNTSLSGFSQSVPVIRPPFTMTLEFPALFGAEVLAWRAAMSLFEGRANRCRIPLFDLWFAARDRRIGAGTVPHGDGSPFSDGTLYSTADIEGVTVTAEQGARNFTADFSGYADGDMSELLQAGLYFGVGDHPYIAQRVFWEGNVATVRCSPTIRDDYDAEELRLRPVMIAKLPSDNEGELALTRGRYGGVTLNLVEAFSGPLS